MAEAKGKIIKKSISPTREMDLVVDSSSSLIEGEVYDASQVAKDLLQKAQKQAEEITSRAQEEKDRVLAEARDAGYQEGLAKSTEYVVKAKEFYQRTAENSKNELKVLAVKIAEKIVGRAIEMDPELINDIVTQAIRTLRQQKNVTVRCHEDDLRVLKKNEKEFLEQMGPGGVINFVDDPKITRGGTLEREDVSSIALACPRFRTRSMRIESVRFWRQPRNRDESGIRTPT